MITVNKSKPFKVAFASLDGTSNLLFKKQSWLKEKIFSFSPTFDFSGARGGALSKP